MDNDDMNQYKKLFDFICPKLIFFAYKEAWKYFFFDKRCGDDSWYRDDFYCIQTDKRQ